jgi:hypothetical protein
MIRRVISGSLVGLAVIGLAAAVLLGSRQQPADSLPATVQLPADVVVCDVPGPNGTVIKSLAHQRDCLPAR